MKNSFRTLFVLLTLLLSTFLATSAASAQSPQQFDEKRAYQTVQYLTGLGSRQCGGPKEKAAFDWVQQQAQSYGLTTKLVPFKYNEIKPWVPTIPQIPGVPMPKIDPNEGYKAAAIGWPNGGSYVLLAAPSGEDPADINGKTVLGAHIDSVAQSVGGNDNASGSATLLEVTRVSQKPGIRYQWYGCEEAGLFGSEFVAARYKPSAMVSLDMTGFTMGSNKLIVMQDNPNRVKGLEEAAGQIGWQVGSVQLRGEPKGGTSDNWSFGRRGIPAAVVGFMDPRSDAQFTVAVLDEAMHSAKDTAAHVSPQALKTIGDWTIAWLNKGTVQTQPAIVQPILPDLKPNVPETQPQVQTLTDVSGTWRGRQYQWQTCNPANGVYQQGGVCSAWCVNQGVTWVNRPQEGGILIPSLGTCTPK